MGDSIAEQNLEMKEFLEQFPVGECNLNQKLTHLEESVCAIRSHLECKQPRKRVTLAQLNEKVDLILKVLNHNGLYCKDE